MNPIKRLSSILLWWLYRGRVDNGDDCGGGHYKKGSSIIDNSAYHKNGHLAFGSADNSYLNIINTAYHKNPHQIIIYHKVRITYSKSYKAY